MIDKAMKALLKMVRKIVYVSVIFTKSLMPLKIQKNAMNACAYGWFR